MSNDEYRMTNGIAGAQRTVESSASAFAHYFRNAHLALNVERCMLWFTAVFSGTMFTTEHRWKRRKTQWLQRLFL